MFCPSRKQELDPGLTICQVSPKLEGVAIKTSDEIDFIREAIIKAPVRVAGPL